MMIIIIFNIWLSNMKIIIIYTPKTKNKLIQKLFFDQNI